MGVGISDSTYYVLDSGEFFPDLTNLDTVHKVLMVNDDPWLFGFDLVQTPLVEYPVKLSTGVPL